MMRVSPTCGDGEVLGEVTFGTSELETAAADAGAVGVSMAAGATCAVTGSETATLG